jgi:hypothetical protein
MTTVINKGQIGEQDLYRFDGSGTNTFTRETSTGKTLTLNKFGYEVNALTAYGGGALFTDATVTAALTAIGTTNKATLFLSPGTWVFNENIDYSTYTNVTFKLPPGAIISHSTYTLNIPNIEAGLYQIFTGTGAVTLSGTVKEVYPEWFGATADNSTDNTAAMNIAINMGLPVRLQQGTYMGNPVHTTGDLIIQGAGNNKTFLKSYSATGYAFTESLVTADWTKHLVMNDLGITGGSGVTRNGFVFGDPTTYSTNIHLAGRCEFNRVAFSYLDKAFFKPYGNIGNIFNNCSFSTVNYGCYATWDGVHTMHPGCDIINGGEFALANLAAIYIDTTTATTGQTVLNNVVIENNPGFAIFVYNYYWSETPMMFNNVYMEHNNTVTPVTINGTSYTTQEIYLRNADYVVMNGCKMIAPITLVNSHLVTHNCHIQDTTVETVDATSSITHNDVNSYKYSSGANTIVNSYGNSITGSVGTYAERFLIKPRSSFVFGYTKECGNHYTGSETYAFLGTSGKNADTDNDGIIYGTCASLMIPAGHSLYDAAAGTSAPTIGKWYAWSIDVKLMTNTALLDMFIVGAGSMVGNMGPQLVYGKWVSLGGVLVADSTDAVYFPYFTNNAAVEVTVKMSAAQLMEFATKREAINYFNAGFYQK